MKSFTHILFLGLLVVVSSSFGFEARSGAASVSVDNLIYIFGGKTMQPLCNCADDKSLTTSEVSLYDTAIENFVELSKSSMKYPRAFHGAALVDNSIYIFGGHENNTDLEVFDTMSGDWSVAAVDDDGLSWTPRGQRPSARHSAAVVALGTDVYVFGGIEAASGNALNDFWKFDTVAKTWVQVHTSVTPSPRAGTTVLKTRFGFAIFGGFDTALSTVWTPRNRHLNTLWVYNPFTGAWTHATPENSPSPRAYAAGYGRQNELFVFGGETPNDVTAETNYFDDAYTIDLGADAPQWKKLASNGGSRPTARSGAAGSFNAQSGYFYLFFGQNNEQREPLADTWIFTSVFNLEQWTQGSCLPGYYFPGCQLDCSENNWCNGHGTCLGDGQCCCDAGWTGEGRHACSENPCDDYRGFTTDQLNQILLPKSFESTYNKLNIIVDKLKTVRDLLPSIEDSHVDMKDIAEESYTFYQSCLVGDLCKTTECFEDLVGCDAPCGSETFCVVHDVCQNGQCINGTARDCSQDFKDNKCVNSWCDEEHGCMHATVKCNDHNETTTDSCDPAIGCVFEQITCDDGDCCTRDHLHDGECVYHDKCEDWNPCTRESCVKDCDHPVAECHYEWEENCIPNDGQNPYAACENPEYSEISWSKYEDRPMGRPLEYTSGKMVPAQTSSREATGFFWVRYNGDEASGFTDCELIYDIKFDEDLEDEEDGAHFYGPANEDQNSGVVHTLKAGHHKRGSWNFCADGVKPADLLNGKYYSTIFFAGGDVRTTLKFEQGLEDNCDMILSK